MCLYEAYTIFVVLPKEMICCTPGRIIQDMTLSWNELPVYYCDSWTKDASWKQLRNSSYLCCAATTKMIHVEIPNRFPKNLSHGIQVFHESLLAFDWLFMVTWVRCRYKHNMAPLGVVLKTNRSGLVVAQKLQWALGRRLRWLFFRWKTAHPPFWDDDQNLSENSGS